MDKVLFKALPFAIIIGCISIWSTYILSEQVSSQLKTQSYLKLENIAKQVSIRFQDAIDVSFNDLQALQAFYTANQEHTSLKEFNHYMQVLNIEHRNYIQALSWVPLVMNSERENFEATIRTQQKNFNINARDSDGNLVSSSTKPYYTPVTYISPYDANKSAQGFDLNSNSTRRASLEYASKHGKMTTTAKIRLVQETGDSYGFLLIAPVYKQGLSLTNTLDRTQALLGYVTGVFRINTLMINAHEQANKEGLELTLIDMDNNNGGLLYGQSSTAAAFNFDLTIPDRQWQLGVSLNNNLQESIESPAVARWILLGGILISILLSLSIYALQVAIIHSRRVNSLRNQLQCQNNALENTVAERTQTLAQNNMKLERNIAELTEQRQVMSDLMAESETAKVNAEQRAKDLARSNKDLDDFAYVASHDLKAPLRGIDQLACWVAEDIEEGNFIAVPTNLKLMRKRVQRLETLLNDLLAYSRANRKADTIAQITCNKFITDMYSLVSPSSGFTLEFDGDMPDFSTVKAPFAQVIRNLLSNAVKHHDKERGHIRVRCDEQGEFYQFSVEDDGPGIKKDYQEDIFKMFRTLKPRDETEGSGMGLALIRKIVQHYHGSVSVKSALGQGSTFYFTWPKNIIKSHEMIQNEIE